MNALRLYFSLASISIRSQMQYRASFFMLILGHFIATGSEALGLLLLFSRFQSIHEWTLSQTLLLYGTVQMAFAFSETIGRGFDKFSELIQRGDFDRYLLRPRSTLLQIFGSELQLMRMGRFLQGIVAIGWAMQNLELPNGYFSLWLMSFLGTVCVFLGLLIIRGAICFWTIESLEIMNIATHGGAEALSYPVSIYKSGIRGFFTYFVPLAGVSYAPISHMIGKGEGLAGSYFIWLYPLSGLLFLLATTQLWNLGVRRYRSTGS